MVSTKVVLIATLLLSVGTTVFGVSQNDLQSNHFEMDIENYHSLTRLRHLSVEFNEFYENITINDLLPSSRIPNKNDLQCLADLTLLTQGLSSGSIWSIRMFDSWGSIPSGLLKGNLKDLGNYDECLAIDHTVTSSHNIKGKYCFAKILPGSVLLGTPSLNINTAVCFPSACSGTHMDTMLRRLFKQLLNVDLSADIDLVNDATCKTAEREPFDGLTIFVIVLLSILGFLMISATLYDYFLCEDQKQLPVLVKAFSARANSRSLFRLVESKSNPNVIDCLNGIRCLSLVWVLLDHDYIIASLSPNINLADAYKWYGTPFAMLVRQGVYAVDTFFYLSGLLVVVVGLRALERTKGKLNVPLMYLHRYLRLTPVLAIAMLIYVKIGPRLGDGPLHNIVAMEDYSYCRNNWFWTLLYVQNYFGKGMCLFHSWYLAVDMQLFIVSPILIIVLYKWGKKGAAAIVVLILLLASCLFSMMIINNYSIVAGTDNTMEKIYFGTQTRASPYLIGILFGYFIHVNRGKAFKLNRLTVWLGWIIALSLLFTCQFALYGVRFSMPILNEAFYLTFARIAWPLGICWVIFACMQGYGGLADSFLSSPLWQPLSKISYCAYIFHVLIENLNGGITKTHTYFSDYQVMLRFWSDFGFIILLAYFMYILIEAPFGNLEGLLLPTRKPTPSLAAQTKEQPPSEPVPSASTTELEPPLSIKTSLADEQPSVTTTT